MEFQYAALDEKGHRFAGTLEAENKTTALATLTERYPIVTRLEKRTQRFSLEHVLNPIRGEDILSFSQTLAAMLEGGITLKRAIDTIYHDVGNRLLRGVLMDVSSSLGSGSSLSDALSNHKGVFDDFFISMVKAGQDSGELPEMLNRVSAYLEKTEQLKDQVKSALTYPFVVLAFAGFLVAVILAFGVPYLRELYDGLGLPLPASTQVLVTVGTLLSDYSLFCVLALLVGIYLIRTALRNPVVAERIDGLKLALPKLGSFHRTLYTARFSRTLCLLYSGGIPLLEALELAAASVGNKVFAKSMEQAAESLRTGSTLSTCLRENPYFLDAAIGMISAGEESGKLDKLLDKVANFYDNKVHTQLEALTSTIEPLMMILIGIVIGAIIVALGLPFLSLASQM
ncbi:MAG: type II secretion system F family protein [Candidatus Eremiobacteraeota bacterium]|nr:type II secretion system F family protein [Candidatus Eremiobacteraeota bacterium]